MSNKGMYIVLDEAIDNAWYAEDHRYQTLDEAVTRAKKMAFRARQDYYVAQIVSGIELLPDVKVEATNLLEVHDGGVQPEQA